MQLPGISPTIPATEAPTDLSRARLAIVVGNQIMSVPAEGIGNAFGFQPLDSDLTAIAALTTTTYGRSLLTSVSAAALFSSIKQAADTTTTGVVELATNSETQTGTDATRAVTPAGLRSATRELLLANRTYYVRTDGSDSNDGSANTSGSAFLTLQKAVNVILTVDLNGFDVTIAVADGTYTGATIITKNWVGGTVIISGSTSAILSVTSNHVIATVVPLANLLSIVGLKLATTTAGDCIRNSAGGTIWFTGTEFGACAANHINADAAGAIVECRGSYTITGGATNHVIARYGGFFRMTSRTATLSGTPAFSTAFANATTNGTVLANGSTFSGAATGKRYQTDANAVINSGGGGASHFPGSVAGTTATGGQYI